MEKATTCTFTGHRENKLPWRGDESDPRCVRLKERIYDAVEAAYVAGMRHFICGMATGCDFYFERPSPRSGRSTRTSRWGPRSPGRGRARTGRRRSAGATTASPPRATTRPSCSASTRRTA